MAPGATRGPVARNPGVVSYRLSDGLVLLDTSRSEVHLLNASGARIWEHLDRGDSIADTVRAVAEETGVPASAIRPDVRALLARLQAAGLLYARRSIRRAAFDSSARDGTFPRDQDDSIELRILGFAARVHGPAMILSELRELVPEAPECARLGYGNSCIDLWVEPGDGSAPHRILRDGDLVWSTTARGELAPALEWVVVNAAIEALSPHYLFFHAGVVARDGHGVLLPGASGSGKTTLTAGLIASGFQYLCDEAAALVPSELEFAPFPKALCVKPGSVRALARLYPGIASLPARPRVNGERVRYLHPPQAGWSTSCVAARYVVFPTYSRSGPPAALTALPPSIAFERLLPHVSNLGAHARDGMASIAGLLKDGACFALTYRNLASAIMTITDVCRH